MSYVESNLIPGERVLYKTGRHWIVRFWSVFFALFFGIAGLFSLISAGGISIMTLLFLATAGLLLFLGQLSINSTEMAVTNKRVVIKTGMFTRRSFELLLSKVESIGVEEGMLGRMLGYGSVVVRGTGGTPEPFTTIAHPLEFRRQVQQQVEQKEQKVAVGAWPLSAD